jgi:predicted nuclease of predicted toxin-antitoxin system
VRFLADIGVAPRVVGWLREQGHDASHLSEEGLHRLPDSEIFQKAIREESIL